LTPTRALPTPTLTLGPLSLSVTRNRPSFFVHRQLKGIAVTSETMCRNITTLRGLEPAATDDEIEAAARQYVRKVSGVAKPTPATADAFEQAVREVAKSTTALLALLPPRKQPPTTVPPLRRPEVRARLGLQ
jgi:hypothetical protein